MWYKSPWSRGRYSIDPTLHRQERIASKIRAVCYDAYDRVLPLVGLAEPSTKSCRHVQIELLDTVDNWIKINGQNYEFLNLINRLKRQKLLF